LVEEAAVVDGQVAGAEASEVLVVEVLVVAEQVAAGK
jgi:hypothetical protein